MSEPDLAVLARLDRQLTGAMAERVSGEAATLFDLERVAELIGTEQPEIVFQPVVCLGTGQVLGYEALSRFRVLPVRSPDAWFAQATRVGLGIDLEIEAIKTALASFDDVPPGRFVSVNVSAATLNSTAFAGVLEGVPGERVVIELTEHEFVEDYRLVNAAVARFRERGFRLAVDDAGSGCAGTTHIVKLRPDVIKLDRTLTHAIDLHPHHRDVAASLVALARGIGATVVGEGIESEAEADALVAIGVDEGQGYHLGRPAPTPWRRPTSWSSSDGAERAGWDRREGRKASGRHS